jgi:hypothetical protein
MQSGSDVPKHPEWGLYVTLLSSPCITIIIIIIIIILAFQPTVDFSLPPLSGGFLSHIPQSVGLLWTSDRPVAETST